MVVGSDVPAMPVLSRRMRALEVEDDECLCSTNCVHTQDEVEVDECICSVRCKEVHRQAGTGKD